MPLYSGGVGGTEAEIASPIATSLAAVLSGPSAAGDSSGWPVAVDMSGDYSEKPPSTAVVYLEPVAVL